MHADDMYTLPRVGLNQAPSYGTLVPSVHVSFGVGHRCTFAMDWEGMGAVMSCGSFLQHLGS